MYIDLSGLLEGIPGPDFYNKQKAYFDYLSMWLNYMGRWDKLMYGSDWPLVNIADYIYILKQVVPQEHHEEFFYGNALNVYGHIKNLLHDC